ITASNLANARTITQTYSTDGYFVTSVTNALQQTTLISIDPKNGQKISTTDANNLVTTYLFDGFDRPIETRAPGTTPAYTRYRACTSCPTGARMWIKKEQDGAPSVSEYVDELGRSFDVVRSGFPGSPALEQRTSFDARGQKTSIYDGSLT